MKQSRDLQFQDVAARLSNLAVSRLMRVVHFAFSAREIFLEILCTHKGRSVAAWLVRLSPSWIKGAPGY